jgi:hypothetical protein
MIGLAARRRAGCGGATMSKFGAWVKQNALPVVRWALAGVSVVLFVLLILWSWPALQARSRIANAQAAFGDRPYNDLTKVSIDLQLDQARGQFAWVLLLAGVLWGMFIVKKDQPTIAWNDLPELLMFLLCNVAMVVNAFCYFSYMTFVSGLFAAAGEAADDKGRVSHIPDILGSDIIVFADTQRTTLVLILVMVVLVFVSTNKLKGP